MDPEKNGTEQGVVKAFDPDQPRDEHGRWMGAESTSSKSGHEAASKYHKEMAKNATTDTSSKLHTIAAEAHDKAARWQGQANKNKAKQFSQEAQSASSAAHSYTGKNYKLKGGGQTYLSRDKKGNLYHVNGIGQRVTVDSKDPNIIHEAKTKKDIGDSIFKGII